MSREPGPPSSLPAPQAPLSSTQLVKISHKINSPAGRRGIVFPAKMGNPGVRQLRGWGNSLPWLRLGDSLGTAPEAPPPWASPPPYSGPVCARCGHAPPHPSMPPPDPAPATRRGTGWEWRPQHTKPQWTTPQTTPSANQPSPSPSKGPTLLGQGAMPTPALVSCPPLPMTLPPLEDFLASPDRDHLSFQAHPTWPCYT